MPRYILKLDDLYCEWSTIVDAPVTAFMPLDKFKAYYRNEYGEDGMRNLDSRMARVDRKGVSSLIHDSPGELIAGNRAGKGESELSKKELLRQYADDGPDVKR